MTKMFTFGLLLICNFLMCSSLSVVTPFFPPYAMSKGITEEIVGLIISANPIGAFFASLYLGKILNENNRFFYMILGLLLQATGMFIFAFTYYLDNNALLITQGIAARMMSGTGAAFFGTSFLAYVPMLFPNKVEKMIGISELAAGFGFLIGPITGSSLYNLGGYLTPFITFGSITLTITPIIYCILTKFRVKTIDVSGDDGKNEINKQLIDDKEVPKILNQISREAKTQLKNENSNETKSEGRGSVYHLVEDQSAQISGHKSQLSQASFEQTNIKVSKKPLTQGSYQERYSFPQSLSDTNRYRSSLEVARLSRYSHQPIAFGYLTVLKRYPIFMTFMINVICNFVIMYFAPTLSPFLESQYGATPNNVGLMLSVYALTYMVASFGVTFIINHKRGWLITATTIIAIGFVLMSPDVVLQTHSLVIVLSAQGVIGVGVAISFILSLPTLNDLLLSEYPDQPLESANIASALFNASMSIGELIGPIVAGFFTKYFGFEIGCLITSGIIMFFVILDIPVVFMRLRVIVKETSV